MKKQKKQSLKARDLTPLKNVTGGKHRKGRASLGLGLVERADAGPGPGHSPQ